MAKQALSVEQSALSAPGSMSDARYSSPDDSAWETVTKKGNKGNKAASKASAAPSAAAAAAAPGLQTQTSGLSQSGRVPSGLLSGLTSQQSGSVPTPAGTPSTQSRTPEGLHPEGSQSEESVASVHARSVSQDNESLMGTASTAEQKPAQQLSTGGKAVVEAGADAATVVPAAQAAARPANWAGLLKSPQSQQQQDWDEEDLSASQAVAAIVSDDAFPQLGGAVNAALDDPTPSHLSVSDNAMSFDTSQGPSRAPSQGPSQTPSESELHSVASSPFASGATARLEALASEGSSMSGQESQDQIAHQLHANAAIWGTGITSGSLSGISGLQLPQQLPQQPQQQPKALYQTPVSAATPPVNNPWEPQVHPQQPPSSAPAPQAPAKPAAAAPIKSVLPPNAQPFVPQARLSTPPQWQPGVPLQASLQHARQQQHQQAAAASQQQAMPATHAFLQGSSFGRGQQSTSMPPNPYSNGFNSVLRPQQTHTIGVPPGSSLDPAKNRGVELGSSAALQQLQRQQQAQQHQHQAGVSVRQQQLQQQQQQLADIWSQPSLGPHQNGGAASQASGPFSAHQQPSVPKGKPASTGSFAAPQGPAGSAFQQHQVPFSHQYPGLQQQQQGRGGGFGGRVNGNHFAGPSMNGMANGHMSSTGTQSEDDELLSGVFNKVWEDNLQVQQICKHACGCACACVHVDCLTCCSVCCQATVWGIKALSN